MSKQAKCIICLLFLGATLSCHSQNKQIDSLRNLLTTVQGDTPRVNILNQLANKLFRVGKYDTAMLLIDQTFAILNSDRVLPDKWKSRATAKAFTNKGAVHFFTANYSEALENYTAALQIQRSTGDKKGMAFSYNNIGGVYFEYGKLPEALKNYFAALKLKEELHDQENIPGAYINIGNVYYRQNNFTEALKNYMHSLYLYKQAGNKEGMGDCYTNMGNLNEKLLFYDKALDNYETALYLFQELNNAQGIADLTLDIGVIYENKGEHAKALSSYFSSLKMQKEIGDQHGLAMAYGNIGAVYSALKDYKQAQSYSLRGLKIANDIGEMEQIQIINERLSKIYMATGNHTGALSAYKAFIAARDSLLNEENTKKTVRLEMNYEFDKKEAAAKLEQEKKEAVALAESKKQKVIIWSVCGVLLLVLAFAVFAYRSFLQKRKSNIEITKQKHLIEEKQKEILDSIYYARRIQSSLMPRESYIAKTINNLKK